MSKYHDVTKPDPFSPKQADAEIFKDGTAGLVDERVVAKPIPIFDIAPDPRQPRRAMPSVIRGEPVPAALMGDSAQITWRLDFWARRAYMEITNSPPRSMEMAWGFYRGIVESTSTIPDKTGIITTSLLAVADLAAAIKRDGKLTNPITVGSSANQPFDWLAEYVIETGERRWLAYHLLYHLYGDEWAKIPARVQEKADVWKQASENNQRSDLNAIGKARQFAILLMDLLQPHPQPLPINGEGSNITFKSYDDCDTDQEYYAQVADGETFRIPYGKSDMLLNAMGVKGRQSLNNYRTLLKLPEAFWIQGDDENWGVNDLLQIVQSLDISTDKTLTPQPPLPEEHRHIVPHGEGEENGTGADYSGADLSQVDISQVDESALPLTPNPSPSRGEGNSNPTVGEYFGGATASPTPSTAEHIPNGGKIRLAKGVAVWTKAGRKGVIDQVVNANLVVVDFGGNRKPMQISDLLTTPPPNPLYRENSGTPPTSGEGEKKIKLVNGDWVQAASGQVGQVVDTSVYPILVQTTNGVRKYLPEHLIRIEEPRQPEPNPTPSPSPLHGEGSQTPAVPEVTLGALPWRVLEVEQQALWGIEDHGGKRLAKLNNGVIAAWIVDMANLMGSEEVQGALRVLRYAFDRTFEEETSAADLMNDIETLRAMLNEIEPEIKQQVDWPEVSE